jgi:hypothetical protein
MTDIINIDDESLATAIKACRPYEYLEDLTRRVAEHLGHPDLYKPNSGSDGFCYRVYCLNRKIQEQETQDRIASMGFLLGTTELLANLENHRVEMLFGVGGIFGEHVESGTIKANGRGGFVFLPKGKRTKGYVPTYIRVAGTGGNFLSVAKPLIKVVVM